MVQRAVATHRGAALSASQPVSLLIATATKASAADAERPTTGSSSTGPRTVLSVWCTLGREAEHHHHELRAVPRPHVRRLVEHVGQRVEPLSHRGGLALGVQAGACPLELGRVGLLDRHRPSIAVRAVALDHLRLAQYVQRVRRVTGEPALSADAVEEQPCALVRERLEREHAVSRRGREQRSEEHPHHLLLLQRGGGEPVPCGRSPQGRERDIFEWFAIELIVGQIFRCHRLEASRRPAARLRAHAQLRLLRDGRHRCCSASAAIGTPLDATERRV
eukprot:scaffold111188_cov62-Phaeocystis_antarctica.AAC.5